MNAAEFAGRHYNFRGIRVFTRWKTGHGRSKSISAGSFQWCKLRNNTSNSLYLWLVLHESFISNKYDATNLVTFSAFSKQTATVLFENNMRCCSGLHAASLSMNFLPPILRFAQCWQPADLDGIFRRLSKSVSTWPSFLGTSRLATRGRREVFFIAFRWQAGHCFCWHYQCSFCFVYSPPLTQSFFCAARVTGCLFLFCTGITAFNHTAHARLKYVWTWCIYDYVHPLLFFAWVTLFPRRRRWRLKFLAYAVAERRCALAFLPLLFCVVVVVVLCFVLSWLHYRVSGRWPTYLRARASSFESDASSRKVIWFVWARLYIDAGIVARPQETSFFLVSPSHFDMRQQFGPPLHLLLFLVVEMQVSLEKFTFTLEFTLLLHCPRLPDVAGVADATWASVWRKLEMKQWLLHLFAPFLRVWTTEAPMRLLFVAPHWNKI